MGSSRLRPLAACQLYTFVDAAYLRGRSPAAVAQALCEGGSDLIQLRAKGCSRDEIQGIAHELLPITAAAGVWLVINDFPEIAASSGAPACHLGQEDFFDSGRRHVRELNHPDLMTGLSTHAPAEAQLAISAGADYIAIGPIFPTGTKPSARPVTLDYVRWAAANVTLPWFAIGGVNLETVDAVVAAGARRICVVSAILNTDDLAAACRAFKQRLPAL